MVKTCLAEPLQNALFNGFSVIPLVGGLDLVSGKKPAIHWKPYQTKMPTSAEIQRWFEDDSPSPSAYGIICGQVSSLTVLDFDDTNLFLSFAARFPHLLQTQIVQSRRGFHVYWRVHFPVQGRHLPGADLKGDGGYVVGPGSVIGGVQWTVIQDQPIASISETQLNEVLASLSPSSNLNENLLPSDDLPLYTPEDTLRLFHAHIKRQHGHRNKALYQTACELRDIGYTQEWTTTTLLEAFVWYSAGVNHPAETPPQRYREGHATIASAFKRPPQPRRGVLGHRLPNSLREAILHISGGALALRLLEGLGLAQLKPGASFTIREAEALLQGVMSRDSINQAVHVRLPDDDPIFGPNRIKSAFVTNFPTERSSLSSISNPLAMSASQGERVGRERGYSRPPMQYTLPDSTELCERLGIKPTYGDLIQWADLISSKSYREALNQRLIRRRRGHYSQAWLGHRLNVGERTIYNYLRNDPHLHSAPTYHAKQVDDVLLGGLPYHDEWHFNKPRGYFLMSAGGKCYPAKREIAERYRKAGQPIWFVQQKANFYWYGVEAETRLPEPPIGYRKLEFWPVLRPHKKRPIEGQISNNRATLSHSIERPKKELSNEVFPKTRSINIVPIEQVKNEASENKPSSGSKPQKVVKLGTLNPSKAAQFSDMPPTTIYIKDFTPADPVEQIHSRRMSPQRYFRKPLPDPDLESVALDAYTRINAIALADHHLSLPNARRLVDTYGPNIVRRQVNYLLRLYQRRRDKVRNPDALLVTNCKGAWLNIYQRSPFRDYAPAPPEFTAQPIRGSRHQKENGLT
ncbi:MAG: bifunctional DNA primase/polymerase [Anaerolineae bacterium]|nr:MAG: bifunctional DNA primase/polymerase [Anaerolineae bacterium]